MIEIINYILRLIGIYTLSVILAYLSVLILNRFFENKLDKSDLGIIFIPLFNILIIITGFWALIALPFFEISNIYKRLSKIEKRLKIK